MCQARRQVNIVNSLDIQEFEIDFFIIHGEIGHQMNLGYNVAINKLIIKFKSWYLTFIVSHLKTVFFIQIKSEYVNILYVLLQLTIKFNINLLVFFLLFYIMCFVLL